MTKREAIIQATIEVVAEKGLAESPTILLAKRACAAELTLFRLFGSKNDLLNEAYDEILNRFHEVCARAVVGKKSIEDKIGSILKSGITYYREKPEELAFGLRYSVSPAGELQRPDFLSSQRGDMSGFPIIALLIRGIEAGVIKKMPICVLFGLLVSPVISLLREEQVTKINLSDNELQLVIDACLGAIKT